MSETPRPLDPAKPVVVLYGTYTNHTRLIAERVAADLDECGFPVEIHNVRGLQSFNLDSYAAAVLAAPVHMGKHEKAMVRFVKAHRAALECLPAAFISVSMSEAGAERRNETPEKHAQFVADVNMMLERFFVETGWRPTAAIPVAGAISYSHYNFLVRFVMKQIAKREGGGTDTSEDYEYTDWDALDAFANEFARKIRAAKGPAGRSPEPKVAATKVSTPR
jgi:menaquinone-dependent protoporphyrinogen oxidase